MSIILRLFVWHEWASASNALLLLEGLTREHLATVRVQGHFAPPGGLEASELPKSTGDSNSSGDCQDHWFAVAFPVHKRLHGGLLPVDFVGDLPVLAGQCRISRRFTQRTVQVSPADTDRPCDAGGDGERVCSYGEALASVEVSRPSPQRSGIRESLLPTRRRQRHFSRRDVGKSRRSIHKFHGSLPDSCTGFTVPQGHPYNSEERIYHVNDARLVIGQSFLYCTDPVLSMTEHYDPDLSYSQQVDNTEFTFKASYVIVQQHFANAYYGVEFQVSYCVARQVENAPGYWELNPLIRTTRKRMSMCCSRQNHYCSTYSTYLARRWCGSSLFERFGELH